MRPRPATWTAFGLAVHSVTLFHARGMGGVHLVRALRKAPVAMHSADRHLRSELRKSICNTTVAGGQSCRVWRTLEEAATPGQPVARRSALLEDPSWRFTLENHQAPPALPQCSGRAHRTSRSNVSTVRPARPSLQGKIPAPLCRNCGCRRFLVEGRGKSGPYCQSFFATSFADLSPF
jgi:hypothetical protein